MNAIAPANPRIRFESRLGRVLIERGHLTRDELAEALDQQLILGGHLVTNLWELGLMEAAALDAVCCELLGVPPTRVEDVLGASPAIRRRLSAALVERTRVLPIRMADRTLHVATCEPWNDDALKEVAFATGLRLAPHYLAEVAVMRLSARLYQTPLSARFRIGRSVLPRARDKNETAQPPGEELMPEEFFADLHGGPAEPGARAPADANAAPDPDEEEIVELEEIVDDEPLPMTVAVPESAPEVPPSPPPPSRPIATLEEAGRALAQATSRDDVGRVLVRFALGRGRRVVLLTLRGSLWFGWLGAGPGVDEVQVRSLMLPSEPGTAFGLVGDTGAPFLGPLAAHTVHDVFLERIGDAKPGSVGLFPIQHRGRLAFGIYLDGGDGADLVPDVGELILLAQRTAITLDRLLSERLG